MAPPNYLNGTTRYRRDVGVTDVTTIITDLTTEATALTPAWTNLGGGHLQSPADSAGRKMDLQFNRISATNLEMVGTDGAGRSFTRRAQIAGGGSNVDFYVGQFHMVLDWVNAGTSEGLHAIMLDETPESQTSHDKWLNLHGSRDSSNVATSWKTGSSGIVRASTYAEVVQRVLYALATKRGMFGPASGLALTRTQGGSNVWFPAIQMGDTVSGTLKIRGKWYQHLLTNQVIFPAGSEVSVPIDGATTAVFRVLNVPVPTNDYTVLAVRKN
jgi:hypothetical protein